MKKQKTNYVVIALIVLLLALAIGYAAFSANLVIDGTANANGKWDVKFVSAVVDTEGHQETAPVISAEGDTLTVDVKLGFPGDACTVTANIKNSGTVPAKLTQFKLTDDQGATYKNDNITVTIPTIAEDGTETIGAGDTCSVTFGVKWNTASTVESATANFKINFTYEQAMEEVNVEASHGTHTTN